MPGAPAVPGGQVAYGSPASSQAAVDSLGTSSAFAAAPYPGDVATSLPGTIKGLSNGQIPVPEYPFFARSSYPTTPEDRRQLGVNVLAARSDERSSEGTASFGGASGDPSVASGLGKATAGRVADGSFVAESTARVEGFAVGTVLRIGEVSSRVSLRALPGQPVTKERSFSVASVTVNGAVFGFTDQGLVAGGQTITPAANSALAGAGIGLEYVPATETDNSVTSASLRVRISQPSSGGQPITETVTLGAVSARLVASAIPTLGDGVAVDPTLPTGTLDSGPAATDGLPIPTGSAAPVASDVDVGAGTGAAAMSGGNATSGSLPSADTGAAASPPEVALATSAASPRFTFRKGTALPTGLPYLALVVAGIAGVAGSRLLGAFAVRRPS